MKSEKCIQFGAVVIIKVKYLKGRCTLHWRSNFDPSDQMESISTSKKITARDFYSGGMMTQRWWWENLCQILKSHSVLLGNNDDLFGDKCYLVCFNLASDIVVEEEVCIGIDSVLQPPQPVGNLLSLPVEHVHVRHPQPQDLLQRPLRIFHRAESSLLAWRSPTSS